MSDPTLELLTRLSCDVGRVEGKIDSISTSLTSHIDADSAVETRVRQLEDALASQRGSAKVWSMLAAAVGSFVAAIIGGILYLIKTTHK